MAVKQQEGWAAAAMPDPDQRLAGVDCFEREPLEHLDCSVLQVSAAPLAPVNRVTRKSYLLMALN
jgi:hypothetical protein